MIAKIKLDRPAYVIVQSLYGHECNSIIKDIARYQKKQISFEVLWSDELHTAILFEKADKSCDFYMLSTCDIEIGEDVEWQE